jgi:alpha/beta superfamily hydrolase
VTYRLAQTFRDGGLSCARFNFRGVGRSSGAHDEGVGEIEDARTVLDWVAEQEPQLPLWLGGFSFGARTALQLALRDRRVEKVLAVGLAVDIFDLSFLTGLKQTTAFIHSDRDEYGGLENVRALLSRIPAKHQLFVVPQADHLCNGRLDAFSAVAKEAFDWLATA